MLRFLTIGEFQRMKNDRENLHCRLAQCRRADSLCVPSRDGGIGRRARLRI